MNTLAFDTCFGAVSVAVGWQAASGEWRQRDAYEDMTTGQAERLMPMIAEVMREAGLAFSDLHRIAVTRGPGTFTGVRVGVSAARALSLATGVPLVAATSLHVMAMRAEHLLGVRDTPLLAVAVDARRGGLYVQTFKAGSCDEHAPAADLDPAEAARRIAACGAVAVGSGAGMLASASNGRIEARLPGLQPHAADLLRLAAMLTPEAAVAPLYLRPPDAKPPADAAVARAD